MQLRLMEVLHSSEAGYTLVSIGRFHHAGFTTTFSNSNCIIQDQGSTHVAEILWNERRLHRIVRENEEDMNTVGEPLALAMGPPLSGTYLGLIALTTARELVCNGLLTGLRLGDGNEINFFRKTCSSVKATRLPIGSGRGKGILRGDPLGCVGTSETYNKGSRCYVTFTNDFSRWAHVDLLASKDEVSKPVVNLKLDAPRNLAYALRLYMRSDREGEYTSAEFQQYLRSRGTEIKLTTHDVKQRNRVTEGRDQTIHRAFPSNVIPPKYLWADVVLHIVWLMHRTETRAVEGKTPFEVLEGRKLDLRLVRK